MEESKIGISGKGLRINVPLVANKEQYSYAYPYPAKFRLLTHSETYFYQLTLSQTSPGFYMSAVKVL